jgi:hypothetical protein
MFNLMSKTKIERYHNFIDNKMKTNELKMGRKWYQMLKQTYENAANEIKSDGHTDLTNVLLTHRQETQKLVKATFTENLLYFGTLTFDLFKKSLANKSIVPPSKKDMESIFWQEVNNWMLANIVKEVVNVTTTTKQMLTKNILFGMNLGLSNYDIAKMILEEKSPLINAVRAARIVRTETHTAANKAINSAVKSTGYDHDRTWISALDERVRGAKGKSKFNHLAANGQKRGMEEPFDVSGEKLMYPGDMNGSAGNIVNCRCVLIYDTKFY